jgi:hypothetical protein
MHLSALALAAVLCWPVPAPADAGSALRMDLEELADGAALAVEARVQAARPGQDARGLIHTDYDLVVARTFYGADAPTRTVRLPGGVLSSGRGMLLPGLPELAVGEELVLLLSPASASGVRMPIGLGQGKFRLVTTGAGARLAVRTSGGAALLDASGRAGHAGLDVLPYAELSARLQAAANAKRARGATDEER